MFGKFHSETPDESCQVGLVTKEGKPSPRLGEEPQGIGTPQASRLIKPKINPSQALGT